MTDVLIRDVPDEVLAGIDAHAAQLGISRVEYIRRRLAVDVSWVTHNVAVEDLHRFAANFGDLDDPQVMAAAWR